MEKVFQAFQDVAKILDVENFYTANFHTRDLNFQGLLTGEKIKHFKKVLSFIEFDEAITDNGWVEFRFKSADLLRAQSPDNEPESCFSVVITLT